MVRLLPVVTATELKPRFFPNFETPDVLCECRMLPHFLITCSTLCIWYWQRQQCWPSCLLGYSRVKRHLEREMDDAFRVSQWFHLIRTHDERPRATLKMGLINYWNIQADNIWTDRATIHTMVNKVVLSHLANPLNPLNKILTFNFKSHISLNAGYTKTL